MQACGQRRSRLPPQSSTFERVLGVIRRVIGMTVVCMIPGAGHVCRGSLSSLAVTCRLGVSQSRRSTVPTLAINV